MRIMILKWIMAQLFGLIDYVKQKEGIKEPADFEELDYDSSINWYSDEEIRKVVHQN